MIAAAKRLVRRLPAYRAFEPFLRRRMLQHDLLAMAVLAPWYREYLPWTTSSMRPSALCALLNEVLLNGRREVVECGGGISTFFLAEALRRVGGRLLTVEDDGEWAALLGRMIRDRGFGDVVQVVHAPLAACSLAPGGRPWYDMPPLGAALEGRRVDMLLVDGPAAHARGQGLARYPAGPFFRDRFGEDYSVFLDDIRRSGEREVAARWDRLLGVTFRFHVLQGQIALARSRPAGKRNIW